MKDNILAPILLVLSVILIASFFIVTPNYVTENGDVKHFEAQDFSFDMAKSWTVYEYDDFLKTPFLSNSPDSIIINPVDPSQFSYYNGSFEDLAPNGVLNTSTTNATDVVIVKTEISKHDSLPEGVTLDNAYKSDSLYQLMDSSGQFSMGNNSSLEISGKQARQFNYAVGYTSYMDTWIESDGHYYRILSQAPNSVFKNAQPQFDFIVETFKVK